jgi:TPR repeat protein
MRKIGLIIAFLFFMTSLSYGEAGNYTEALRLFKSCAEKEDPGCQNMLGSMYANGQVVPQNYREAMKWYKLAAENGDVNAQRTLGLLYRTGQYNISQDYEKAFKWYGVAAKQGDVVAQINIGDMYQKGEGVSQDYIKAHIWYNLAASDGDKDAIKYRETIEKKMTKEQIRKAQELAEVYYERIKKNKEEINKKIKQLKNRNSGH